MINTELVLIKCLRAMQAIGYHVSDCEKSCNNCRFTDFRSFSEKDGKNCTYHFEFKLYRPKIEDGYICNKYEVKK